MHEEQMIDDGAVERNSFRRCSVERPESVMVSQREVKRVRVAFDHDIFVDQEHGGISRYVTRLAEHLPEFGVDPKIIAPLYHTWLLKDLRDAPVWGRHVSWSPRKVKAGRLLGDHLHAPLVRLHGAKIVHETYYRRTRIAPRSCRVVMTVHDMIAENNLHIPEAVVDMENKREGLKRADKVICISEATRQDLLHHYPHMQDRAVVVHYGFDSEFCDKSVSERLHPKPYILFVGVRRSYKGFDRLLEAYASSKLLNRSFDIICVSHHTFNDKDIEVIRDLGLEDKVFHRFAKTEDILRAWYNHAAVFAQPSLHEGFGLPLLEAMAANCPVVCMNTSVMPEICGDAAEYAEPGSLESLRSALESVVLSPAKADALRAAGRERIKLYSWQECARRTSEVYKAL